MRSNLGWAEKKGGIIKNWKRRYFVLSEQQLNYYESAGGKLKGKIPLSVVTGISKTNTPQGPGLTLATSRRVWELVHIEGDPAEWAEKIGSASPLVSKASPVLTSYPTTPTQPNVSPVPLPTETPAPIPIESSNLTNPTVEENFGLLLCGSGESGKTTFLRQLQLRFRPGGIQESDRLAFVPTIRGNLIETMQLLLVYGTQHDLAVDDALIEQASLISGLNAFNCEITTTITDALEALWGDESIQEAFSHHDETVIPDHMDYFFTQVQNVMSLGYVPTDDDLLKARIRTIGIDQFAFQLGDVMIEFYDLGGQRNERSKINQIKDKVNGLAFCVSFADFDKPMFEALPYIEPRIHDSISFFAELTHTAEWMDAPVFLICNKFDGFQEKVMKTDRFTSIFPDYTGDVHDVDACAQFMVDQFKKAAQPGRQIEVMTQVALDAENVVNNANQIGQYVQENWLIQ
jgi:GTPase SAR1 family protein